MVVIAYEASTIFECIGERYELLTLRLSQEDWWMTVVRITQKWFLWHLMIHFFWYWHQIEVLKDLIFLLCQTPLVFVQFLLRSYVSSSPTQWHCQCTQFLKYACFLNNTTYWRKGSCIIFYSYKEANKWKYFTQNFWRLMLSKLSNIRGEPIGMSLKAIALDYGTSSFLVILVRWEWRWFKLRDVHQLCICNSQCCIFG